jgi:hypothetical protein
MGYDARALERATQTFRADMWQTVCEDAVEECGIEERRFGPIQVTVFEALPDSPFLNQVLGAAEPGAVEDGHLKAAIEWADSFGVNYRVLVARGRPCEGLSEAWLNWHGFEQRRGLVKYVRDASPPDLPWNPEIKVWEIGQEEAHGETLVDGAAPVLGWPSAASHLLFALPVQDRWRTYTAELEEQVVSFGSMLIHCGVAVLGLDATVEEARRRGCNLALLHRRLLAAFEARCDTVVAEVPEGEDEGLAAIRRNLLRAGFVPAYSSMSWQRPPGDLEY